jgi:hypothetical protein
MDDNVPEIIYMFSSDTLESIYRNKHMTITSEMTLTGDNKIYRRGKDKNRNLYIIE